MDILFGMTMVRPATIISKKYLITLDAQPIVDEAVAVQLPYMMQAGGVVKYTDQPMKPFQQTLITTAEVDKWNIPSDCCCLKD